MAISNVRSGLAEEMPPQRLAHDVYFTLKDDSEAAKLKLVTACRKYLAKHPGILWFDAGVRVESHRRDVNDLDFDVVLHIHFRDQDAHDQYQNAPQHHEFIRENRDNWERVRVFDSWILETARPEVAQH